MSIQSSHLRKEAIIGGSINGVINGTINWFSVKDKTSLLLTDNLISSTEHTVFAGAVPLAVSLAFILTSIAYFTTKMESKPGYFPKVFFLGLKHSVYAFGLVTIFALLLQRFAGSVSVSPIMAAGISAVIAGLVGAIVNYETKRAIL